MKFLEPFRKVSLHPDYYKDFVGESSDNTLKSRISILELKILAQSKERNRIRLFLGVGAGVNLALISYYLFVSRPSIEGKLNFAIASILSEEVKDPGSYNSEFKQINSILRYLLERSEVKPVENEFEGGNVQTLIVTSEKANLRSGPSLESEIVMAVSKGMELVVEEIDGDWSKVFAPNGLSVWISSSVVSFGNQ